MTGPAQERWLLDGLDASNATWNVLAQQVMMGELDHKIYDGGNTVYWQDAWDGFPAARKRGSSITSRRTGSATRSSSPGYADRGR